MFQCIACVEPPPPQVFCETVSVKNVDNTEAMFN